METSYLHKLQNYLRCPYPVVYGRWKGVLVSSILVFLILALLQPFGLWAVPEYKLLILLGYGCVTALFQLIPTYLFPFMAPRYYRAEQWTLGKQLLQMVWILFFVGVGNSLYSSFALGLEFGWLSLGYFLVMTVAIGIFPIGVYTLLNQNRLLTLHLKESQEMNAHLQGKQWADVEPSVAITFQGGSKEVLTIDAASLLYVEAEGNYIKVVYIEAEKVTSALLRATMKQAEDTVLPVAYLVRCHRAFLVNVQAVVNVGGNSQGYRLKVKGCVDEIPVSRAYSKSIKTWIEMV